MKRTPFQGEKQIKLQVYRDVNPVLYWKFNKALREQLGIKQLLVILKYNAVKSTGSFVY